MELCIASNIILSLEFLNELRDSGIEVGNVSVVSISSRQALSDCDFCSSIYCADLFSVDNSNVKWLSRNRIRNKSLYNKIKILMDDFSPDIAITTSQNRYLKQACDESSVPLLSCEFGPLPRTSHPLSRFLSLDGHLSDGPFRSVRALKAAVHSGGQPRGAGTNLQEFLDRYSVAVEDHPQYVACRDFISSMAGQGSIAMLVLQPEDWLTWEGALSNPQSAASVILRAVDKMSSDKLIVTFHPALEGRVVGDQFSEIWLSNPSIIRLPQSISVNSSECFLPLVDEVLTVSSNVAMSAFLLAKNIKSLGNSFVNTLEQLSKDKALAKSNREMVAKFLIEKYCILDEDFCSPKKLKNRIDTLIEERYPKLTVSESKNIAASKFKPKSNDSLEIIHENIKNYLLNERDASPSDALNIFGRHAIGYQVQQGAIGAELGVAAGTFSDSLLMSGNFEQLYSVDAWSDHHDDEEFKSVERRLGKYGKKSKIIRQTFSHALKDIPDEHLDFIYIDAYAHTGAAADILKDWMPKLKDGALIAGHDFCSTNWPLNYSKLSSALNELKLYSAEVPGVFTFNTDDIFPSFIASRRLR